MCIRDRRRTILDLWATLPEDNRLITADINRLEAYDMYGEVPKKIHRNQIAHDERKFTALTGIVLRGGKGSGHHGHAGRPGEVGGSLPSTGHNISEFLKVPQTPLWAPVNRAFAAIEKVHGVNPLKNLRVFRSKSKRRRGSYYTYWTPMGIVPEKMGIRLGEKDDASRALTTTHETGHFLDHTMFGSVLYFTSEDMIDRAADTGKTDAILDLISDNHDEARAYQKWWKAITRTQEYFRMETYQSGMMYIDDDGNFRKGTEIGAAHYRYTPELLHSWRQPGEYFARSYSQYIATRSGDDWMQNEIESELQMSRRGGAPTQWEEESFEPIAKAFDELFDSVGLLR